MSNAAVFLDRDGVLNVDKGYVYKIEDFQWCDNAPEALKRLRLAGYKLIVITNQSGVARGMYSESDINEFHNHMQRQLAQAVDTTIDGFYYCPHHPEGVIEEYSRRCDCRKPGTKLGIQALEEFTIDVKQSYFVGDKSSDINCGKALGMTTVHIAGKEDPDMTADQRFASLAEFVSDLLG